MRLKIFMKKKEHERRGNNLTQCEGNIGVVPC